MFHLVLRNLIGNIVLKLYTSNFPRKKRYEEFKIYSTPRKERPPACALSSKQQNYYKSYPR